EAREPADRPLVVRFGQPDAGLLEAAAQVDEAARGQDVLEREIVVLGAVLPRVLAEVADGAPPGDRTPGRFLLPRKHLHRAGLAGPVAADHADLVAGAQVEGEVVHDDLAAYLDDQPTRLEGDHRGAPERMWERAADMTDSSGVGDLGSRARRVVERYPLAQVPSMVR